jgi:hypothetical protein
MGLSAADTTVTPLGSAGDYSDPYPKGTLGTIGWYGRGFLERALDGFNFTFWHDMSNAGRYGGVATASNVAGYVSDGASTVAGVVQVGKCIAKITTKKTLKEIAKEAPCFAAGTEILTPAGLVPIETIRAGDTVIARDETSGQVGEFPVVRTFERMADSLVLVGIGDETVEVTEEHPFWVCGQGWVAARELGPGVSLMGVDGQPGSCQAE